jgi:hypothetical protein
MSFDRNRLSSDEVRDSLNGDADLATAIHNPLPYRLIDKSEPLE